MATESELLAALREWSTTAGIPDLKDLHLRHVLRSGKRTAQELSSGMPPSVTRNAAAIAAALAEAELRLGSPEDEQPATAEAVEPTLVVVDEDGERDAAPKSTIAPGSASRASGTVPPSMPTDDVGWEGFEEWDYLSSSDEVSALQITVRADGTQVVRWPTSGSPAVYRLVSSDKTPPFSPDHARRVAVCTGSSGSDTEPFHHAVRYFQVWRNDGASLEEAKLTQPVLHAEGVIVAPVSISAIAEDSGRVVGHWQAPTGTDIVHVYRVPRDEAAAGIAQPRFRILADRSNLNGITDDGVERNAAYVYQVLAQARVKVKGLEGDQLSPPRVKVVEVAARHEPVLDLAAEFQRSTRGLSVDLSWSTPAGGSVVIYRSSEPPEPGLDREPISAAALEDQARLRAVDRLNQPIEPEGGRSAMRGIPWPEGWARAYFTPVVMLDDQAFVGKSARGSFVLPPQQVRIVERVSRQLLTFDWPEGADVMQVYRSPRGADRALALGGDPFEVSEDAYQSLGGFEPGTEPLPRDGCDLHLVSVMFDGGERITSEPTTVTYPGIRRLRYRCAVRRTLTGRTSAVVSIESREVHLDNAPPFVLVYNPDRLPLSASDGKQIAMVRDSDEPGAPSVQIRPRSLGRAEDSTESWRTDPVAWKRVVTAQSGFVRLFVDIPPSKLRYVALLDPSLSDLRIPQGFLGGR